MIVRFQNGEVRDVGTLSDGIVVLGLDAYGYTVVRYTDRASDGSEFVMEYALTRCCHASAKGLEDCIGCRSCYAEVDPYLGGPADPVVVPVVPAGDPKIGAPDVSHGTPEALNTSDPATPSGAAGRSPRGRKMTRQKATPAAEQFAALGLNDQTAWTPAMALAVKQKWANLPIDRKVDDLRSELAAVAVEQTPDAAALAADPDFQKQWGPADDAVINAAQAEAHRLKRNAKVNAWRQRNQIQAALDARALKFAAMRQGKASGKGTKPAAALATAV